MKRISTNALLKSIFLLSFYFSVSVYAQPDCVLTQRYKDRVFSNINVTYDITYGNADRYDALNINFPQPIKLDFYEPAGDTLSRRPLMLFFYGGAFLLGDKGDADVRAWCDSLAHLGYATAAVNYRLGFNATNTASAVRAVYRAIQDARGAIRFFKEFHNQYKIDTTRIFVGGESAGAITALHAAYLNKETERPSQTYGTLFETANLGCLDCAVNNYQHTVDPKGVISLWGAMYKLSYIESNPKVPVLLIHGTEDPIVSIGTGQPFTDIPSSFPSLYGSQPTHNRLDQMGIYNEFYPYAGQGHVFYGIPTILVTFPNQYWEPVYNQGKAFLYKIMRFQSPMPMGNTTPCAASIETYSVPLQNGSRYCWSVTGGTILSVSSNTASIQVQWGSTGTGTVTVVETNNVQILGKPSTLNVMPTCLNDTFEPNNTAATAKPLPSHSTQMVATLCGIGDQDWFYISNFSYSSLKISLSCLAYNAQLAVFNSSGALVGESDNSGTATENVVLNNLTQPDTYYIRIRTNETCNTNNPAGYCLTATRSNIPQNKWVNDESENLPTLQMQPTIVQSGEPMPVIIPLNLGDSEQQPAIVTLFDLTGRVCGSLHSPNNQSNSELSTQNLPKGIYLLHIQVGETAYRYKVLIE